MRGLVKLCSFLDGVRMAHAGRHLALVRPDDGQARFALVEAGTILASTLANQFVINYPLCRASGRNEGKPRWQCLVATLARSEPGFRQRLCRCWSCRLHRRKVLPTTNSACASIGYRMVRMRRFFWRSRRGGFAKPAS